MSAILEGNSSTVEGQLGWKGERGYSAYEIAVKHGYTGTEAQWSDDFLNAENYYDKSEADALLDDKATKSEVYTKSETDNLLVDTYSTNEELTNKAWVDGKPIYRKVITISEMPKADTYIPSGISFEKQYDTGITNFKNMINMYGCYYSIDTVTQNTTVPLNWTYWSYGNGYNLEIGGQYYTIPFNPNQWVSTRLSNDGTKITIQCSAFFSPDDGSAGHLDRQYRGYIIVEYTKSTDQGGN